MPIKKIVLGLSLIIVCLPFSNNQLSAQSNLDTVIRHLDKQSLDNQVLFLAHIGYDTLVANASKLVPLYEQVLHSNKPIKNTVNQAQLFEQLSLAYYIAGKYDKSFETGFCALNLYDSLKMPAKVGKMYGELGYRTKRIDLSKAFTLMQRGINILNRINDHEELAKIYDNYGVLHEINYCFDSAIIFYKKALELKDFLNDQHGLAYTYANIFIAYLQLNQPELALINLDSSVYIRKRMNDKIGLSQSYSYYGEFYQLSNQLDNAIGYFYKALKLADSADYPDMKSQMHQKLSDCYERKKDPWNALYHLKIYKQLQDSLISDETNKTIADLQIKYDTAEKEKEIERQKITLKTKSVQLLVSLIFTILIILVFVLLYIKYRHKQEIKLNEKLASEKHQRLIEVIAAEENERIRLARELHDGLGQLLSTARINMAGLDESVPENDKFLLQNALGLIDQSVTEVRQVSHNLMPVSLTRYGLIPAIEEIARQVNQAGTLKMTCSYHQTDIKFSESDERTIYRIVQELINNIIKHARATQIDLFFGLNIEGLIELKITNDGETLHQSAIDNSKGIGWKNIKARVALLQGEINLGPAPKSGTVTKIIFKRR